MSEGSPTEWLDNLRSGDSDAARQIFNHFSKRLCRLAERHLTARVQQRADGDDVVQSVFKSFFLRDAQGQFQVDDSDELWRLLVTITLRKSRGVWRKNSSQRRSVNLESTDCAADTLEVRALSREPTVVEALVLADEIEFLLRGLDEAHCKALEYRLAGYTPTEAAEIMGVSRQSFYRLLEPIKARMALRSRSMDTSASGGDA